MSLFSVISLTSLDGSNPAETCIIYPVSQHRALRFFRGAPMIVNGVTLKEWGCEVVKASFESRPPPLPLTLTLGGFSERDSTYWTVIDCHYRSP